MSGELYSAGGPELEYLAEVAKGDIATRQLFQKFGRNPDCDNGVAEDIWNTGAKMTWQQAASTVTVVSNNAADDIAGVGARKLLIIGLDADFAQVQEEVELDGTVSVVTTQTFMRVYRAYVTEMGTYHGSNVGILTATYTDTSDAAFTIAATVGQTEMTHFTVPAGMTGFILSIHVNVNANNKFAAIQLYQCPNADDVASPFGGAERVLLNWDGVIGDATYNPRSPIILTEKTDVWFEGIAAQNDTAISVDYDILLVQST